MKPALILYFTLHGLPRWFSSKEIQELWVPSLGWEDPLEEEMVTHSSMENPMDRGAWWAIVHKVTESQLSTAQQHTAVSK